MAKRVLLTGIGGFIGAHCLDHWMKETDWEIIGIDSFRHKGSVRRIEEVYQRDMNWIAYYKENWAKRVKIYSHDLAVPIDQQLENLIMDRKINDRGQITERKIDYIINMASDSAVERSTIDPVSCLRNNYDLAINMLELARRIKPTVFYQVSSDEVYGEAKPGQSHKEWDVIMPSNPYCLHPDTLVLRGDGIPVKISDINIGDVVFGYDFIENKNKSSTVSNKFEFNSNDNYEIKIDSHTITCTGQHKFFVKRPKRYKKNKLDHQQDILLLPIIEVKAKDIMKGDWIAHTNKINIPENMITYINADLCKFLGYFAGGGHIKTSVSKKNGRVQKTILLADKEKRFVEFYNSFLKNTGCYYKHKTKKCWYSQTGDIDMVNLIVSMGLNKKSKDKTVPVDIVNASEESIASFIGGLFDADGWANDFRIEICSYSKKMLTQVHFMLLRLGITSTITKNKVIVINAESHCKFKKLIPCLKFIPSCSKKPQKFQTTWKMVNSVNVSSYNGKVIDIEVEGIHNFTLFPNILTHNSASKASQEAVAISYWRTYDVPLVITNCMNIIGEWQDKEKFLPKIIQYIATGQEIPIYADSENNIGTRFYLHAKNKADAFVFLSKQPVALYANGNDRPDRYNICGDVELNNLELAQLVSKILGKPLKYRLVKPETARKGYDRRYALDGTKMKEMGWKMPLTFEESLERIVKWTMDNPHWII